MPTVRMLVHMAGPNIDLGIGDICECDDAEAARLIAAGFAEAEDTPPRRVKMPPPPAHDPEPEPDPRADLAAPKPDAEPVAEKAEKAGA